MYRADDKLMDRQIKHLRVKAITAKVIDPFGEAALLPLPQLQPQPTQAGHLTLLRLLGLKSALSDPKFALSRPKSAH